ncbi:trigger factor [Demequina pelophila]|uniref:trigger factor n=1 Tax=Demequina pelophila TaxID=1638984 RepID=UPI0009E229A0|nr:trigger factor [Demequina pelophila]
MTSALEKIDATTVKLTVSLTEADLADSMKHAYEHVGKQVQIPGFRKGKVPAKVLEQRVGKGAIIEHAINDGLAGWYSEAVREQDIRPFGQPEVEVTKVPGSVEGDEGAEFVATVEVRPEVKLPAAADLKVEIEPADVSEADVDERLDALRERFGTLVSVDRPAADGDFVTLDLAAVIDGETIDNVQGTSYQIGAGNMLEGLDEAVTGLSADEETTYEGPLAAGDHAGETAQITVKVTAVKTRELPEADDDFAQLASEFDTLAELREDLEGQAKRIKANNQAMEAREKLLELLADAADFELPKKVIESEVHAHLENENRLEDDEHRAEVTEEAKKALRTQIILDQLAEDLSIEVEQSELLDYLLNAARQYQMDPGTFIGQVEKAGQMPAMVSEVARSKATAFALRRATVVDTNGAAVDLSGVIGSLEDEKGEEAAEAEAAAEVVEVVETVEETIEVVEVSGEGSVEAPAEEAAEAPAEEAPAKKPAKTTRARKTTKKAAAADAEAADTAAADAEK